MILIAYSQSFGITYTTDVFIEISFRYSHMVGKVCVRFASLRNNDTDDIDVAATAIEFSNTCTESKIGKVIARTRINDTDTERVDKDALT